MGTVTRVHPQARRSRPRTRRLEAIPVTALRIGGVIVPIKYYFRIPGTPSNTVGQADYPRRTIRVATSGHCASYNFDTLLHEILHMLDDVWHIQLTHNHIKRLAPALVALLVENPALCKAALQLAKKEGKKAESS